MTESLIRFFKSSDFYKGFVLALAILIVLIISHRLGHLEIGVSLTMGMFISAPANVPGSIRHRLIGILTASFLGMVVTIAINFATFSLWLLIPVLGALVFLISFISVYGFRASLVSFSGLLAIILSFAHPQTGSDVFVHAGLIGLGGLWYMLFSHLSHLLAHRSQTLQLMAECMEITAVYLKTRGELALEKGDKKELQKKLFELQTEINAKHETLREILLSSRRNSGQSNFSRRQVLIFIELIDILELAIGNLPNVHKIRETSKKHPEIMKPFTELIFEMAGQLEYLSKVFGEKRPLVDNKSIDVLLQRTAQTIASYKEAAGFSENREGALLLQNVYDYLQKQSQKIEVIQKVMNNLFEKDQMWLRNKDAAKFITQQDYDWKTLTENLSFKSPIFKHSLRLTLTFLIGFAIGVVFSLQNSYWILLTIIVIMRPGYALTKQRSKHRLYGTLIGGTIAFGVVFITQNEYIYGVLAVVTFILAFSLVQKNYKSSAIFITLNIVFVYALLKPDASNVIQFRVLDTLMGATLAIIANSIFWPSWEYLNIQEFIGKSILANRLYLEEINNYYHHKDNKGPSYKLSRKKAFLAIGDLNAAFQRMTQEPKSRQKELAKIYEIVVLNHTFLSLAASLGTFIQHHKTTEASRHFETYIASICGNLEVASHILNHHEISDEHPKEEINEAQKYLDDKYQRLTEQHSLETVEGSQIEHSPQIQEVKLISDQLKWLYTISENLKNLVRTL
ncbi:MAG: FUSC family membrane protein [Anditalea sp.]